MPKVIDFGIAKATQGRLTDQTVHTAFEQFIGTPAYMSPEQAEMSALDIDTRSDIYSLGVLLYELLTGQTPFDAKELMSAGLDAMRRIIREVEPVKPSTRLSQSSGARTLSPLANRHSALATDLDWIVMKCLEKDRARRYETANGLAADIQRHLDNEPVNARPPGNFYRLQKAIRRNKGAFAAATAIAVVLVAGVVVSTTQAVRAKRAEREQARQRQIAETKERKSEQVAQFLQDMLKGVGPSVALGRDTTMLQEILDKTAERIGKDLTNQPEVEVELWLTLAATYHDLGLYQQMEAVARQSLQVARSRLGEENENVAVSLTAVGDALMHLGAMQIANLDEAEKYTRDGLAMSRKLLGNENLMVADALTQVANVLSEQGKLAEAETIYREALAMSRKLLGNEHPKVAKLFYDIATVLSRQADRPAEAEAMNREALAMQRKLLGDDHPEVAKTLGNLAATLLNQGKEAEAETKYREALAMWKKLQSNDRIEVADTLHTLAILTRAQGKLAEAETTERDALAMYRRLFAKENDQVVLSLSTLARILAQQGRLSEAETLYREALAMQRKLRGNEDPAVALALNGLVDVLLRERKFDEAEHLFNEIFTPTFESQPKSAWFVLIGRGSARARMGRWNEAAADFSRWLVEFAPEEHFAYHGLAALLVQSGDLQGYRLHCAQELAHFAGTTDPNIADRMAKDCLILPDSGVDLSAVGAWADTAVRAGKDRADLPWFQLCKGLAEYRQGHFVSAADWIRKGLAQSGGDPDEGDVEAYMVLAMAQCRSQQTAEAKATLAKGVGIAETKLPNLEDLSGGWRWIDWIIAHALMREAKALIEAQPPSATEKKSEPR